MRSQGIKNGTFLYRWVLFLLWILVVLCVLGYCFRDYPLKPLLNLEQIHLTQVDFKCYYGFSRMMAEGNPYLYSKRDYAPYLGEAGIIKPGEGLATYPPSFYFIIIPVTYLPVEESAVFWFLPKYPIILLISVFLTFFLFQGEKRKRVWILSILFWTITLIGFSPTLDDVVYGQINIYLLFLILLALFFMKRDWQLAGGMVLGLIFCLKLVSAFFILYYLIKKKWSVAVGTLSVILMVNIPVLILYGVNIYRDYYGTMPTSVSYQLHYQNLSLLQKIYALLKSVNINHEQAVSIAFPMFSIFSLTVVIITFYSLIKHPPPNPLSLFSLLIPATLLTSPIQFPYYHIWLFIPWIFILQQILLSQEEGQKPKPGENKKPGTEPIAEDRHKDMDWNPLRICLLLFSYIPLALLDALIINEPEISAWRDKFIQSGYPLYIIFILWIFLLCQRARRGLSYF